MTTKCLLILFNNTDNYLTFSIISYNFVQVLSKYITTILSTNNSHNKKKVFSRLFCIKLNKYIDIDGTVKVL